MKSQYTILMPGRHCHGIVTCDLEEAISIIKCALGVKTIIIKQHLVQQSSGTTVNSIFINEQDLIDKVSDAQIVHKKGSVI